MADTGVALTVRLTVVQMTVPAYRRAFFEALRRQYPGLQLFAGEAFYDSSVSLDPEVKLDARLENRWVFRRSVAWQRGVLRAIRESDVVVAELNPRTLSTWLLLALGRVRATPVIVWGHFAGREGYLAEPRFSRRLMVRMASGVVAYTEVDAQRFSTRFPKKTVGVAPNATELLDGIEPAESGSRTDFVYVGRLVSDKGLELLVSAFADARARGLVGLDARLVIRGGGPLRDAVIEAAERLHVADVVIVGSPTYSSKDLNALYRSAVASVCGGYVGLNLTQSLTRGVPMVFPQHAPHAPEAALAEAGVNAFIVRSTDVVSFADALGEAWGRADAIDRQAIQGQCRPVYNVEAMVRGFDELVRRVGQRS